MDEIKLLLLLLVANGAPVIAYDIFRQKWAYPIDGGRHLADGNRLFGDSNTYRGWISALISCGITALLLGYSYQIGLIVAALAMTGDTLSGFVKRRLGHPPGSKMLGLDQIPESLLPVLGVANLLQLDITDVVLITMAFFVLVLVLSRILFKLNLRKRPY